MNTPLKISRILLYMHFFVVNIKFTIFAFFALFGHTKCYTFLGLTCTGHRYIEVKFEIGPDWLCLLD